MLRKIEPFKQAEIDRELCAKEFRQWAKSMGPRAVRPTVDESSFYRTPVPGEPVTITGLRRRAELNGVHAEILSNQQDEFGRLHVRLHTADKRIMKIQPCRLMPEQPLRRLDLFAICPCTGIFDRQSLPLACANALRDVCNVRYVHSQGKKQLAFLQWPAAQPSRFETCGTDIRGRDMLFSASAPPQAASLTGMTAGGGIFTSSSSSGGFAGSAGASAPALAASSGSIFATSSGSSGSSGGGIFSAIPSGSSGGVAGATASAMAPAGNFGASSGSSAFGPPSGGIFGQGGGPAGAAFGAPAAGAQSGPSMFAQAFQQSRPGPGGARRRRR
ncbi:unnamed protein product [Symbiodinium natans]|uniref:Uncharacterized protein n=1 Tax=Symbiodinium natans TaxID=878477 RepID=A0A812JCJ2_9DINO|nr:unnamed protein product [Symbiodinium natans]